MLYRVIAPKNMDNGHLQQFLIEGGVFKVLKKEARVNIGVSFFLFFDFLC